MPPPIAPAARLRAELDRLADEVAAVSFALPSPQRPARVERREELVSVVGEYLIFRLGDPGAPLLAVVAGPTGSGKSTLVNSLAEKEVSSPGALRPTTRRPVVWCHSRHADRYTRIGSVECKVVADDHPLLEDITVVDTPDIDSYVAEHRLVTHQILRQADLVVFITSAQRYADAVPWEVLGRIDRRGSVIVYVLNRLSRRASGALSDYSALLRRHGLASGDVHSIQEQRVRGDAGLLPTRSVAKVAARLRRLAADREVVLTEVTAAAVRYIVAEAAEVARAVEAQDDERRRLEAVVDQTYADALGELTAELDRGALIRREVVERWSERVGTGEVARWVAGSASWVRGVADRLAGRPASAVDEMEGEARRELTQAVTARLERAARAVTVAWDVDAPLGELVTPDLRVIGEGTEGEVGRLIDDWLASLTRLVSEEAPGRFRTARVASTGMNAAAVGTILALFAATGGISGAEMGAAAGAAAAQQAVLEQILGRAAARSLSGSARDELLAAVGGVFEREADRYRRILAAAADPPEAAARIRAAADDVERESEAFHGG